MSDDRELAELRCAAVERCDETASLRTVENDSDGEFFVTGASVWKN